MGVGQPDALHHESEVWPFGLIFKLWSDGLDTVTGLGTLPSLGTLSGLCSLPSLGTVPV